MMTASSAAAIAATPPATARIPNDPIPNAETASPALPLAKTLRL
jgi:hypothetical protein